MVVKLLIRGHERIFRSVEISGKTVDCEDTIRVENGRIVLDGLVEMYGNFKVKKDREDIIIEKL